MANAPVKKFEMGHGVQVSIWLNRSNNGESWHTVSISRVYKSESGYKDTQTFRRDDLLFVAEAAHMAYRWCQIAENKQKETDSK